MQIISVRFSQINLPGEISQVKTEHIKAQTLLPEP